MAVDAAGNLYIASRVVLRVGPDGILSVLTTIKGTYAGRFGFFCSPDGDGGPSSAASVRSPSGLSIDAAGNLYVAENDRIRKITIDGLIHTVAGGDQCTANSADGSPATSVCLSPFKVAVGADGSLYITEAIRNLVRKVTSNGVLTTILNTISGFAGDGGPATAAKLSGPGAVATDAGGNLYIADIRNGRLRKVTADGVISTIAGNGRYGLAGDGGPADSAETGLLRDVVIDSSDNIYILDGMRVRKITTDGLINTIAGCFGCPGGPNQDGVPATESVLWTYPFRIEVDAAGTLYIAEADRVRKVGADGIITTIFGNGEPALGGDGGPPSLNQPLKFAGFALDPQGGFYISGNDGRIRKVTPDGVISTIAGSGLCRYGPDNSDGGPATSADLCPGSIKVDAARNIYVAERGSANRIRKISAAGIINTVAGGNSVWGFSGDGGVAQPPPS